MPLTLAIREVLPVTPRARIVRLDLEGCAFPYRAGQSVLIGRPGSTDRRAFSLADAPEDARALGWLEFLIGTDDDGRTWIPLVPGERVTVEGPIGQLTLPVNASEPRFVFVAGGTGIAPLRAMVRECLGRPRCEVHVFYSARTPDDFAYADELQQLARAGRISLALRITRGPGGTEWGGERGRFDPAWLNPAIGDGQTRCFICGPQAMVHDAQRLLERAGVPRRLVHVEEWCRLRSETDPSAALTPVAVTTAHRTRSASL
jgi:aromatic O-demethylase, reductase subunit